MGLLRIFYSIAISHINTGRSFFQLVYLARQTTVLTSVTVLTIPSVILQLVIVQVDVREASLVLQAMVTYMTGEDLAV